MQNANDLIFYHAYQSRSCSVLWLLEELDIPYQMELVDIRATEGVPESYRTIQPHKKVPAIVHQGVTITERAAIAIYLADAFPEAGLAPQLGDPARGPYLSALTYVDSVVDPCMAIKFMGWEYTPANFSFGAYDDMLAYLEKQLTAHAYVIGDHFTAADTQLGSAIYWAIEGFQMLPNRPVFQAYLDRVKARPAFQRMVAKDAALAPALALT